MVPVKQVLAKRLKDIIFTKLWFLVWKNIRERQQKYDTVLTKTQHAKNFFSLIWLAFQRIGRI